MAVPAKPSPKPAEPGAETEPAPPAPPAPPGGFKPWLPLLANLVLMPVLAYGTVTLLILPKMHAGTAAPRADSTKGETAAQSAKGPGGKEKILVPLSDKILVNVAGTMGTRYLLAKLTLVGATADLKVLVEKNDAELRDAAGGALSVKTISDLEKPGARNVIRTELISVFNHILGEGAVTDIYLTEFAIQ